MDPWLRVGLISGLERIDPHHALHYDECVIQRQLFESLYRRGDGWVMPNLLTRRLREVEDGGYAAPLREGLRLSDGSELTPELVRASLQRCPAMPEDVKIEVRGQELWFSPERSRSELRDILSSPFTAIAKRSDEGLIGTGSFAVELHEPERLRLRRNPHHVGATASVEGVEFTAYGSPYELGHALARGELDYTSSLSGEELPRGAHVRKSYVPTPSTALLWINTERVTDVRLRQAVAHALDKRLLLDLSYRGVSGLSATSTAPANLGAKPDQLEHDPERSRELLAGRRPKLRLRGIWGQRPYLPDPAASAAEIARQLELVGFEIDQGLVPDAQAWRELLVSGDYDLLLGGWYADEPSLAAFLSGVYHSQSAVQNMDSVGSNFARYADPAADQLLTRYRATGEEEALTELSALLRKSCPAIALHHGAATVGLGERVIGREFDELAFPVFASFTLRRN